MSCGVLPWVYPIWNSLGFLDLGDYFLPHFRGVFNYYLLNDFLMVFLFVFFFWDSYNSNVGAFHIVLEVSEIVLMSFNSFFLFPLWFIYFYHSIFYFPNPILLFVASRVFLISFIVLFIIYWLFFSFFYVLVKPFLHFLNPCLQAIYLWFHFFIQDFRSFSLSLFGYLYQVDSLSLPLCLVWWAFILFLYLLGIPLSLHPVYIAAFGVTFLYSGSLWSYLYCGVSLLWVGLDSGLSRFPG